MSSDRTLWFVRAGLLLTLSAPLGCSDPLPSRAAGLGPNATACEHFDAISRARGCTPIGTECSLVPACETLGHAWLDCVERDLHQCYCEDEQAGGDLNCEGSFKPDEGPARCRSEYESFDACLEANEGDEVE